MKKQRTLDIIQLFKDYKSNSTKKDEKKKKKDEECEALIRSFLSRLK